MELWAAVLMAIGAWFIHRNERAAREAMAERLMQVIGELMDRIDTMQTEIDAIGAVRADDECDYEYPDLYTALATERDFAAKARAEKEGEQAAQQAPAIVVDPRLKI